MNGTSEEQDSEGDRRPSLNTSTPDDDQSYRDRTSTVPVHSGRSLAQVYLDQTQEAQSQPDLLGLPYTSHENVRLRKKTTNDQLILNPERGNELTSRLSMPPFVFSSSSLHSIGNFPSTSSSNANDVSMRTLNDEGTSSQEQPSSCSLENSRGTSDNDISSTNTEVIPQEGMSSTSEPTSVPHTSNTLDGSTHSSVDGESDVNSISLSNAEQEIVRRSREVSNSLNNLCDTEESQSSFISYSDNTEVYPTVQNNNASIANDGSARELTDNTSSTTEMEREPNIQLATVDSEANNDMHHSRTGSPTLLPTVNHDEGNNENVTLNEVPSELPPGLGSSETEAQSRTVAENLDEQEVTTGALELSPVNASTSEETPSFIETPTSVLGTEMSSTSIEILTVDLPPNDVNATSVEELNSPSIELNPGLLDETEEAVSSVGQDRVDSEMSDVNPTNHEESSGLSESLVVSNDSMEVSVTENRESLNSNTLRQEPAPAINFEGHDLLVRGGDDSEQSVNTNSTCLGAEVNGHPLMDVESEPDIMNIASIPNSFSSNLVIPSQTTNVSQPESTASRRTLGSCNLRTLFQVPDNDDSLANELPDDLQEITELETSPSGTESTSLTNAPTSENVNGMNPLGDPSESTDRTASSDHGAVEASSNSPSIHQSTVTSSTAGNTVSDLTVDENSRSSETLERETNIDSALTELVQIRSDNAQPEEIELAELGQVIMNTTVGDTTESSTTPTTAVPDDGIRANTSCNRMATSTLSSNTRTTAQGTALSARMPSITHVRYLRSKNLSIRLPSETSTALPVVHVVPPHIPLSSNTTHQTNVDQIASGDSSIEAEPVLHAVPVDSVVAHLNGESRTVENSSNPDDSLDAGRQTMSAEASTSHSGVSASGASAVNPGPSTSVASHSASKRRSSGEGSQGGNTKARKKGKSRNRTNRESLTGDHRHNIELAAAKQQPTRRRNEGATNRHLDVARNDTAGGQDDAESSQRPASIYVQISDFPSDEDVVEEPLPPRK